MDSARSGKSGGGKQLPQVAEKPSNEVNIVVIGDSAVGKTALIHSYVTDNFQEEYVPSVLDTYRCEVEISHQSENSSWFPSLILNINDLGGKQETEHK